MAKAAKALNSPAALPASRLISFDLPFAGVPCDHGTATGLAEVTVDPDGPTWISEIWLAPKAARGVVAQPVCLDPCDPDFERIDEWLTASGRIDELAARELAARDDT